MQNISKKKTYEQLAEQIERKQVVKVNTLLNEEEIENPFLIEKLIPERAITALTSDVGKGKSLFSLLIAKNVANGIALFDRFNVKKNKVLIIDLEMSRNDLISRSKSIIKEPCDIDMLFEADFKIDDEVDWEWLKDLIITEQYGLLIIDTLNSAHGKEENSASEMREVNRKILDLINATGISILYLHHHRKLAKGEVMNQATSRGSTEILAKVASHLLLDSRPVYQVDSSNGDVQEGITITIEQSKHRLVDKMQKFSFNVFYKKEKGTQFIFNGFLSEGNIKENTEKLILYFLEDNDADFKTILDKSQTQKWGVGERNLRRVIKDLVLEGKIFEIVRESNKKIYTTKGGDSGSGFGGEIELF